ncbi:MAG: hypothetical protein KDA47_10895 [Planctomycetales bacterium]|nr:hypothetical protein [Planctomycetales bacterium]
MIVRRRDWLTLVSCCCFAALIAPAVLGEETSPAPTAGEGHHSPVDLALASDGSWLVTVNQTADSISLVDVAAGKVLDELQVGDHPSAIAIVPNDEPRANGKIGSETRVLVTASHAGELVLVDVAKGKLHEAARIKLGYEPTGVAVSTDGRLAYVALTAAAQVAAVDLTKLEVTARIDVGRWPRYLAISPDGKRLAVGAGGDRGVTVVDVPTRTKIYLDQFVGMNIGHMQTTADGRYAYFPWVVYRRNPITPGNIRLGWVLATRVARIRLDDPERREAMSLDPSGEAVGDPHGLALTPDETHVVVSASGTHELLVMRRNDLPLESLGSTDHIPRDVLLDRERFRRIPLGGRPMGLRIAADNRTAFVANYLDDSVQVVDILDGAVKHTIHLGEHASPSLARRGEAIFYDARRSLDQWYSCHTCHYEGGGNSVAIDTLNDGSVASYKTVLPLYHVAETMPWTWHGWQTDLRAAMTKSITSTMQGPAPNDEDVDAMIAYLKSLRLPPNPYRQADDRLSDAAERGRRIFEGERGACANCHHGPLLTDGKNHDVGLGKPNDRYDGFNTPSLRGLYRKTLLLHDGRVDSLPALLTGPHDPSKVSGVEPLAEDELADLIEYLKTL